MTQPTPSRTCQTCRYGDQRAVVYLCRRYAPTRPGNPTEWPRVGPGDWCGEHEWSALRDPERQGALAWGRLFGVSLLPAAPTAGKGEA